MIVELKVKNFRSIKDQQTLSLVAGTGGEMVQNTFLADTDMSLRLVRSAVVYGANAGGKSNLLRALLFMHQFIIASAKETQQGEKIQVENFLFDPIACNQPTEFEVTFIKDRIRYQYGYSLNQVRVVEEWLFAYPSGRAQQWFSRKYNAQENEYEWKFSKYFKVSKKIVELTRENVLFLSNAVNLNSEQLTPIFSWFQENLVFINLQSDFWMESMTVEYLKCPVEKEKILKLMQAADPTIIDIIVEFKKISDKKISNSNFLLDHMRKLNEELSNLIYRIRVVHIGGVSLSLEDESAGTKKLFDFAGRWLNALESGQVLIVDELDNSLHSLVVRFLIGLIDDPNANKNNAQLIFSTHNTSLLDSDMFRRDQIWFVEKDGCNSTQLYPLSDFSPRKNEAIGRGYLQGRYGALPYIGEWKF